MSEQANAAGKEKKIITKDEFIKINERAGS